ncbi:MAG: arylsulfatase [Bacteroidota bacterium]
MHYLPLLLRRGLLVSCFFLLGCKAAPKPDRVPNIIIILADDMGYSDVGSFGGEIETPYLDMLASRGLRFTQFYNAARCCPTRASLLTGRYPHQAGMGGMVSSLDSEPTPGPYQGYLDERVATLAERLKAANYKTYLSGKWHVGEKAVHWPRQRGFDRYFGLISGASSYFEVIKDQPRVRQMVLDDTPWEPPADGFYMTDAIADYATRFIEEHVATHTRRTPFFLYVPFTAPHWPLHAFESDIVRYEGVYDVGWDSIRVARYDRLVASGIIDGRWALPSRPASIPAWEDVEDKEEWSRRMAVYAAMVDRMDQGIGRILSVLDETSTIRNTLIIFLSDNGGSAEGVAGRNLHDENSRIGERDSYAAYREPWAFVSNTPFRQYKAWTHEGGIATPMIVYWMRGIQEPGRIVHQPGHLIDLMSTSLELAGIAPTDSLPGISLVPHFEGETPAGHDGLYWEHQGAQAVRQGPWKLVKGRNTDTWELYNLAADRNERYNVAGQYPELVKKMDADWQEWATITGVFERP